MSHVSLIHRKPDGSRHMRACAMVGSSQVGAQSSRKNAIRNAITGAT